MQQLLDDYRFIKEDAAQIIRSTELEQKLTQARDNLNATENYIITKIQRILRLLESNGFVGVVEEGYSLTKKGQMAAMMAEINPIIFAEFMLQTNYLENLTTIQIIQFLSCFTDIKVLADVKAIVPSASQPAVQHAILKIQTIIDTYMDYEQTHQICVSENDTRSDLELCYDLIDIIEEWCIATDELQCKWFIQTKLGEKGISIGDFTKAVLKISNITRELMNVCEQFELVELLSKLAHIDGIILKYITTAQSLYI